MRNDLPALVRQFENAEFRTPKDVMTYAKLTRTIGEEMMLRMHFQATALEYKLKNYKGRWYHFGLTSKVKARIVSAHLRIGAQACRAWGIAGVKMAASFEKHFLEPERIARGTGGRATSGSDFRIGDDD